MSINHELLLDENLSWHIARDLAKVGYDVLSIAQANAAGLKDQLVFQRAQQLQRIILTRDSDFRERFAPPHYGIVFLDCDSTVGNQQILQKLLETLPHLLATDLANAISIISIP